MTTVLIPAPVIMTIFDLTANIVWEGTPRELVIEWFEETGPRAQNMTGILPGKVSLPEGEYKVLVKVGPFNWRYKARVHAVSTDSDHTHFEAWL